MVSGGLPDIAHAQATQVSDEDGQRAVSWSLKVDPATSVTGHACGPVVSPQT
jgi:hypothetical protein